MVFSKYDIDPQEVIFVSDTSGDIREAQEAGVGFIVGILSGYQAQVSIEAA